MGIKKQERQILRFKYTYGLIPIRSASLYGSETTDYKISDKLAVYVVSAKEMNAPVKTEAIGLDITYQRSR